MQNRASLGLILIVLLAGGCSPKADPNKPIDQIMKEMQTMSLEEVGQMAQAYAKAIANKKADLHKLVEDFKKTSWNDLLNNKGPGKQLRQEIRQLKDEVLKLSKRYGLYAKRYIEMGGKFTELKHD